MATFKQRVRQLTRRSGGRSMAEVIDKLKPYLQGWKAYFGLAQTPKVWRTLEEFCEQARLTLPLFLLRHGAGRTAWPGAMIF